MGVLGDNDACRDIGLDVDMFKHILSIYIYDIYIYHIYI